MRRKYLVDLTLFPPLYSISISVQYNKRYPVEKYFGRTNNVGRFRFFRYTNLTNEFECKNN